MSDLRLVSVICLSMNHEKYIEKSFRSVIHQTYAAIEILYVDNNSSDATFQIGENLLKNSGLSFKAYKRNRSYGISENINFLLKQATGKYITIHSADDWWDLRNLEEKIKFYETHPQYGFVHGSGYLYFYDTLKTETEPVTNSKSGWLLTDILKRNFINSIGLIIKKEAINNVGLFDENSPLEDWDMWIRIAEKYEIGFFNKPLVYYGKNTGSNISENKNYMNKGLDYSFKKYSHYQEIKEAESYYKLLNLYDAATDNPSLKNLMQLFRNYQFTFLHFKQIVKCISGIIGFKIKEQRRG